MENKRLIGMAAKQAQQLAASGIAEGRSKTEIVLEVLGLDAVQAVAKLGAASFISILFTVAPVALPVIVSIIRDIRGGKKLWEALVDHFDEILEILVTLGPTIFPQNNHPPRVDPRPAPGPPISK